MDLVFAPDQVVRLVLTRQAQGIREAEIAKELDWLQRLAREAKKKN
jgi:hypothetical protein